MYSRRMCAHVHSGNWGMASMGRDTALIAGQSVILKSTNEREKCKERKNARGPAHTRKREREKRKNNYLYRARQQTTEGERKRTPSNTQRAEKVNEINKFDTYS